MSGYLKMDRARMVSLSDLVAVLNNPDQKARSRVIEKNREFYSRTSTKKIIERLERGKRKI